MIVAYENLKYALSVVSNTHNRNVHQPVLRCALFQVGTDRVSVTTTDLVSTSQVTIPCVAKKEESFLVDFESINNFVKAVKGAETVEFKVAAKVTVISEGFPKLSLPTVDTKLFPKVETPEPAFTIKRDSLASALFVGGFTNPEKTPLNGIHVTRGVVESTNGFIGKRTVGEFPLDNMVLPLSVQKLSSFRDEEFGVYNDKTSIYFFGNGWSFRFLKIGGNSYPETGGVYKDNQQNKIVLSKEELVTTLNILSVAGKVATISIDSDKLKFTVSGEENSAEYELEIGGNHFPNEAVIGIQWLLDILKQVVSDEIVVKFGTRREPIIVEDGNTQFFMVQWNN